MRPKRIAARSAGLPRQQFDTLPPVDGFNRNQNTELRRDLDQDALSPTPGSTLPDTKPARSSTGYAVCLDPPVRGWTREATALSASPVPRMPAVQLSAILPKPRPCVASGDS